MRKITSTLLACAFAFGTHAQLLDEGFDDISTLSGDGWTLINTSLPLGVTDWFQGNPTVFPAFDGDGDAYIGANFNNTTGTNTISSWLITPVLSLSDGDTISFYTTTVFGTLWPDNLQVRLSTDGAMSTNPSGPNDVGSYTSLLFEVNPLLNIIDYPTTWTEIRIVVSGIGTSVSSRIALRYFVPEGGPSGVNSNYIGIDRVVVNQGDPSCAPVSVTISPTGLNALWANQGANDPYTFYYGIVDAKRLNANVSGGVGPFTYSWSNSGTPALLPRAYYPDRSIDLFRPTAATTVMVTVTDHGTGCMYNGSVFIDQTDEYFCNVIGNTWYIYMCVNDEPVCVPWSTGRAHLQNNTGTLGNCNLNNKAPISNGSASQNSATDNANKGQKSARQNAMVSAAQMEIYPNPSNGVFTVAITNGQVGALEILDLSGKRISTETLEANPGVEERTYNLSYLPQGMYFMQYTAGNVVITKKVVIQD